MRSNLRMGGLVEGEEDFQFLPARSRTAVYIPHDKELTLALPLPAAPTNSHDLPLPQQAQPTSYYVSSGEFWAPRYRSRVNASGTEVSITNNTTVLLVDVPAKPIEKLKQAVKKMQRLSRKDGKYPHSKNATSLTRSSSVRPTDVGRTISRYDGGRSSLRLESGKGVMNSEMSDVADKGEMDQVQLLKENLNLKHRLEEEEALYRRRVDTYRLAQQHQATLVSRLQSKVLQYKKRCSDLEIEIKNNLPLLDPEPMFKAITTAPSSVLDAAQQHLRAIQEEPIVDFDTAMRTLTDEQLRNEKLTKLNTALREQLELSQKTNESLTNDLQKLALDWQQMRDEMLEKEEEWKEEEQFFNDYYNNEHNKMLNLWRDIVSIKRNFSDIQASTQRDLNKLRNDVNSTSNDMIATCSSLMTSSAQAVLTGKQQEMKKENLELQSRLNKLKTDYDNAMQEIKQKDDKIQQVSKEVYSLNKKMTETEESVQEVSELQEEVKILFNSLNEISQTILQDADMKGFEHIQTLPHIHLSSIIAASNRSQADNIVPVHTAAAFSENTISAVQASLYKYQSQIHKLQMKISSLSEQLRIADKQNENQNNSQRKLTEKLDEQNDELDSLRAELNLLSQEKESLIKVLESSQTEKSAIEKNRFEISTMLETVNADYDKMLKSNNRLQKIALTLEDEKNFLQNEVERLAKELETRELTHRITEDRCSQMLDELLTIKENLNKERLDRELAEQNHSESQNLINYMETAKNELESELQRVLMEKNEVHDALSRAEAVNNNLEEAKKKLREELKNSDELKTRFQTQFAEVMNDLGSVRKELLHTEQNRLDLESEKVTLMGRCKLLEVEKQKLETELNTLSQERNDLGDQLLNAERKKDVLNEELIRFRRRIEQVGETNARVNKHLEALVKECEEKQILLESNEKKIFHLQELNVVLKSDKNSLEAMLFETQNNLEASEMKREIMNRDIEDLLAHQENLKSDVSKLETELETKEKLLTDAKMNFIQQIKYLESESKQKLEVTKSVNEEMCKRLEQEKEQLSISLEKRMQTAISDLETEKTEEITQLQKKIDAVQQQIDMQSQQYEEALRRAENDKQQALLLAHQDQKAVIEKMDGLRIELGNERTYLDKLRREANLKAEQDRSSINTLRDQITRLTSKIEDMRIKTEEEKQKLGDEIEELRKERDCIFKESEELKVELSLSEDRSQTIKVQLSETNHRLNEIEKNADRLRHDLNDTKRQLNECNIEKDKYQQSNRELRIFIKKSEAERREQARSLEEVHQKISGLEDKIGQLENEKSRIQNVCREVEYKLRQSNQNFQTLQQELDKSNAANLQKKDEEKELLTKLNIELEDKEKLQQELHIYKKQLYDTESTIEANQKEIMKIRQRIREDDDQWRLREQELLARLEDYRNKERKLEDQKHNLELCLADANQQLQELKSRMGGNEGRVRALDTTLSQLEGTKKELEGRLKSIGTIFRRLNAIQQEGAISTSLRMLPPSRRWSPSRVSGEGAFESGRIDNALEVDPECIRKTVQLILQQMSQLERERDDLKIQSNNYKKQLDESLDVQSKNESKIGSMIQCIRQLNEEKGTLEIQLDQKENTLLNEFEALRQKSEETQHLRDKICNLESNIQSGSEEKQQFEERILKLRSSNALLETERQKLREDLSKSESRSARLEIQRIALEGDLNRLQMILQERDAQIQKMQDHLEVQTRSIANLEEKCDSLQTSIDHLNSSLDVATSVEAELRAEIQSLQKSLSDCTNLSQTTNNRIKQLQKTLSNNENEKRLLAERLERTEHTLTELHAECKARAEQINVLQSELDTKEIQRAHIEDQLRFAKMSSPLAEENEGSISTIHKLQIECCDLRGRVQMLEEKLRRLEADKKNLEWKLQTERVRVHDIIESADPLPKNLSIGGCSNFNLSYLEHENKGLKQRCNQLEAKIAEKEEELARLKVEHLSRPSGDRIDDTERYRAGQLRAEHLLKAREQSHRQQVQHLKNETNNLRKRLDQEMKLKRRYLIDFPTENRHMKQLRDALSDSLRTVSQNPTLDALLLDHETKKLNSSLHSVKAGQLKSLLPNSSRK